MLNSQLIVKFPNQPFRSLTNNLIVCFLFVLKNIKHRIVNNLWLAGRYKTLLVGTGITSSQGQAGDGVENEIEKGIWILLE